MSGKQVRLVANLHEGMTKHDFAPKARAPVKGEVVALPVRKSWRENDRKWEWIMDY